MHKSHLNLPMNKICPLCKNTYPPDVKFCINDGARLVAADDSATPNEPQVRNPFEPQMRNPFEPQKNTPFEHQAQPGQTYYKAQIGNRLVAALLDGLIFVGLTIPPFAAFLFAFISAYGNEVEAAIALGVLGLIITALPLGFQLAKDGFGKGQSPGKKVMKLIVIDLDTNMPCNKQKSCLRNLIGLLLGLVPLVGSFIEPIMVLVTDDGRRLGDRAANTMVIDKNQYFN